MFEPTDISRVFALPIGAVDGAGDRGDESVSPGEGAGATPGDARQDIRSHALLRAV